MPEPIQVWATGLGTIAAICFFILAFCLLRMNVKRYGWKSLGEDIYRFWKAVVDVVVGIVCLALVVLVAGIILIGIPYWFGLAINFVISKF